MTSISGGVSKKIISGQSLFEEEDEDDYDGMKLG